jgi:hypothetical protein
MGWPFTSNKVAVNPNTSVCLTMEGIKKAESQEPVGDFGTVLSTLHFGNGCSYTVSELSDRTGIPEKRVSDIIRSNRTYIMIKSSAD